jgi:phosphatidylglycerophosphate synthase
MNLSTASPIPPLLTSTLLNVLAAILLLAGAASVIAALFQLPTRYIVQSASVLIGLLFALLPFLPQHQPLQRFGAANGVTLLRASITALLAGFIGHSALTPDLAWGMTVIACIALLLDGVDGWLARRNQMQSPFGARFDMEVDAFFILVLALLVYQMEKAGVWVLLSGTMRYGFVALSYALPWLRQPLPPHKRRQTICVIQTAILALCLSPLMISPWTTLLTAAGLALLMLSFAVDIVWLARHSNIRQI